MADSDYFSDVGSLRELIASSLFESVHGGPYSVALTSDVLSAATAEITYDSNFNAPDTVTLTCVDPDYKIQTSGLCTPDSEGLLPMVDFNFPAGTDVWWRLDDVSNTSGDLSTAGLQLIFQHRVASYLQEDFGPLKVAPGTTTRAQFVKQLCDRIPKALSGRADPAGQNVIGPGSSRSQSIQFVCPELNVIQPLVGATAGTTTTAHTTVTNKTAQVNKSKAIGYGVSDLTVKGSKMTSAQIDVANALLQEADSLNAQDVVLTALMVAGIFENSMSLGAESNGRIGPLSPNPSAYYTSDIQGATKQAHDFCVGGGGGAFNSAITEAKNNSDIDAVTLAEYAEGAEGQYQEQSFPVASAVSEAKKIVAAYGGGSGGSTSDGSTSTTSVTSDIGQLARGSTDNPDEDSLTCIQRLASQVNFEFYITAHPAEGEWGNYAYYIDGPINDAQMPSAYLTRSNVNPGTWDLTSSIKRATMTTKNCLNSQPTYTVDNTAFSFKTTKTRRGKTQRAVKTVQPQSPTQVQLELVCDPMTYAAGDVFVIANSGPLNGRWLVSETERNFIEDAFDQITLVAPTAPDPEPTITTTTTASTSSGVSGTSDAGSGTLAKAVNLATRAAALEGTQHVYTYTEGDGRTNDGNGVLSPPYTYDCSGFCGGVYNFAGLGAPYGPEGYTGTTKDVQANMTQVSLGDAVPGDLVLFGQGSPVHIVIYIGNNQCVSMGQQGEPKIMPVQAETDSLGFIGYFHLSASS
jgi:cell wall-associated NlpC family hydrolase